MNNPKGVLLFFGCATLFLIGSLMAGAIDGVGFMLVASILTAFCLVVLAKMKKTEPDDRHLNASDSSTQISKLHALLRSGALTQEEFEQEKKKVLSKGAA